MSKDKENYRYLNSTHLWEQEISKQLSTIIELLSKQPSTGSATAKAMVSEVYHCVNCGRDTRLHEPPYFKCPPKPLNSEWEIVAFKHKDGMSYFNWDTDEHSSDINDYISPKSNWNIHSVKRLSDGEVFSVGDEVYLDKQLGEITKFFVVGLKNMYVECDGERKFQSGISRISPTPSQPQTNKEWEIVERKHKRSGEVHKVNPACDDMFCSMHSVKRLSDGEVFTIGDKIGWDYFDKGHEIAEFENHPNLGLRVKGTKPNPFNFPFMEIENLKPKFQERIYIQKDLIEWFEAARKLKNPCQEKTISPMDYEYPNDSDYLQYKKQQK